MKTNKLKRMGLCGAIAGAGIALTGCVTFTFVFTASSGPLFNSGAPPPAGYSNWNDYASAQGWSSGESVTLNQNSVAPPAGYSSWSAFNSNPSVNPPTGYSTWQAYFDAVTGYP